MRLQLGVAGQSLDAEDDSDPGWVAGEDGDDDPESLQVADSQTSAQQTGIPAGQDPGGAKDEGDDVLAAPHCGDYEEGGHDPHGDGHCAS